MSNQYRISVEFDQIKIYINGLVHISLKKSKVLGYQSWTETKALYSYYIRFYLDGGNILATYDDKEKWQEILILLNTIVLE